jgi:hypothetical protein
VKEAWTDERLDDLANGMHREFDQVHAEIRAVRTDLGGEIDSLRAETKAGFDRLYRLLLVGMASIVASVLGSAAAAVVAHAV